MPWNNAITPVPWNNAITPVLAHSFRGAISVRGMGIRADRVAIEALDSAT